MHEPMAERHQQDLDLHGIQPSQPLGNSSRCGGRVASAQHAGGEQRRARQQPAPSTHSADQSRGRNGTVTFRDPGNEVPTNKLGFSQGRMGVVDGNVQQPNPTGKSGVMWHRHKMSSGVAITTPRDPWPMGGRAGRSTLISTNYSALSLHLACPASCPRLSKAATGTREGTDRRTRRIGTTRYPTTDCPRYRWDSTIGHARSGRSTRPSQA